MTKPYVFHDTADKSINILLEQKQNAMLHFQMGGKQ